MAALFQESMEDELKTYIVEKLNSITDADADVLAAYVIALLKHDQSAEKIRETCIMQLDDFLRGNTVAFVNELFQALETRSFISAPTYGSQFGQQEFKPNAAISRNNRQMRRGGGYGRGMGHTANESNNKSIPPAFPQDMPPEMMAAFFASMSQMQQQDDGSQRIDHTRKCNDFLEKGYCMQGDSCPYSHSFDDFGQMEGYDPHNSAMSFGSSGDGHDNGVNGRDRGRGRGRGRGMRNDRGGGNKMHTRRSSISGTNPSKDHRSNASLVVEKIPEEHLNQQAIQNYFMKYGNIADIRLEPQKTRAIVRYGTHHEARSAWDDPAPIFNNRFVKVFWLKTNEETVDADDAMKVDEPEIDLVEFNRKQLEAQRVHEEKMQRKRENELAMTELSRRREELSQKQAEENRVLMEKISQKTGDADSMQEVTSEKKNLTETLKAQLAKLQEEANELGVKVSESTPPSTFRGRGRGRGSFTSPFSPYARGGYRGRGRAQPFRGAPAMFQPSKKVDNRPRRITIAGLEGKDEEFRSYLLGIGDYESIQADPEKAGNQIISFRDRATAEKFVRAGANVPGIGKIGMGWITSNGATNAGADLPTYGDGKNEDEDEGMFDHYEM